MKTLVLTLVVTIALRETDAWTLSLALAKLP
jgi:hypothetical protein